MTRRVNVLGDGGRRLSAFTGAVLDREMDVELQLCVEQAARELSVPIALVTLLLQRTQIYRAHHGLPPELATAAASDTALSICQYVVRDNATVEIGDLAADPRPPTELTNRYGISAYLGTPVSIGDEVVGSLCVLDVSPRRFSPAERDALGALATRVSARLEKLARLQPPPRDQIVADGFRPAFAEIRNQLMPLLSAAGEVRLLAAELAPLVSLAVADLPAEASARALASLRSSRETLAALFQLGDELEGAAGRLHLTLGAVEEVATDRAARIELPAIVTTGLGLAAHLTRLAGPVAVSDIPPVKVWCSLSTGASLLSVIAATLASHSSGPLSITAHRDGDSVSLEIAGRELDDGIVDEVLADTGRLTTELEAVTAEATSSGVRLVFQIV